MKVLVLSEFYPRAYDPVLGIWAHRQALAARDAGADVRVVVLHRVVPPASTPAARIPGAALALARHPRTLELDGLGVRYVRFASPPRWRSYGSWGAWAAPALRRALGGIRRTFPYELVHAHNAVPAADALLRAGERAPLVVSEHGADVFHTAVRHDRGRAATARAFGAARLVLANSAGIARSAAELGAQRTRVVHLGTELPSAPSARPDAPTLVTVAHLIERKRHADDPERPRLEQLVAQLGLADRVQFAGQLDPAAAIEAARTATLFVMPSVDEALGVAYVEAMAGWIPAVAALGEPGPSEIANAGDGIRLVAPGDIEQLAGTIDRLVSDRRLRAELGARARATVESSFTWERCGRETVAAYEEALRG